MHTCKYRHGNRLHLEEPALPSTPPSLYRPNPSDCHLPVTRKVSVYFKSLNPNSPLSISSLCLTRKISLCVSPLICLPPSDLLTILLIGSLSPTHSLTHSLTHCPTLSPRPFASTERRAWTQAYNTPLCPSFHACQNAFLSFYLQRQGLS